MKKTNIATNLVGRTCTINPQMLWLWPWRTEKGEKRQMTFDSKVEPDDATCHRARIVAVFISGEKDGSSSPKFLIEGLEGQHRGELIEVYAGRVRLCEDLPVKQGRRLCTDPRHGTPCVYDGCRACEEECDPPASSIEPKVD